MSSRLRPIFPPGLKRVQPPADGILEPPVDLECLSWRSAERQEANFLELAVAMRMLRHVLPPVFKGLFSKPSSANLLR